MKRTTIIGAFVLLCAVLSACNDIRASVNYRVFANQTNLIVSIRNARPGVLLRVSATNVPRLDPQELTVTTDDRGQAQVTFEYRYYTSIPNWCALAPGERQKKGWIIVHDSTNPVENQKSSKVFEFRIDPLYYHPAGGCPSP